VASIVSLHGISLSVLQVFKSQAASGSQITETKTLERRSGCGALSKGAGDEEESGELR
jgi:hypothetical protein